MLLKHYLIIAGIMSSCLWGIVACTPPMASKADMVASSPTPEHLPNQVQSNAGVVTSVALTTTEPISQSPGQSPSNVAPANSGSQVTPEAQTAPPPSGAMVVYSDNTYQFSVSHPSDFSLRAQPAEKLAQLKPRPAALFRFMSPTIAKSDLGDLEPADLEVRAYTAEQATTLESWLKANNLWSDGPKAFQAVNVAGLELCASTMIAPGCSYFLLGHGWVYQLTPASVNGETMARTFTLLP